VGLNEMSHYSGPPLLQIDLHSIEFLFPWFQNAGLTAAKDTIDQQKDGM